jgi:hypothetical protein
MSPDLIPTAAHNSDRNRLAWASAPRFGPSRAVVRLGLALLAQFVVLQSNPNFRTLTKIVGKAELRRAAEDSSKCNRTFTP